ncbi:MAG: hypothetical protein HWD92_11490 [Flavobacteriia bacterium]|nr:hypothetical protein [Flavobacteriia bacterium]
MLKTTLSFALLLVAIIANAQDDTPDFRSNTFALNVPIEFAGGEVPFPLFEFEYRKTSHIYERLFLSINLGVTGSFRENTTAVASPGVSLYYGNHNQIELTGKYWVRLADYKTAGQHVLLGYRYKGPSGFTGGVGAGLFFLSEATFGFDGLGFVPAATIGYSF